jgi:pimeloyl-ACP methyl ester carboxylesterase
LASHVWFHALEEISMKPLERQPHPITFTAAIVAVALVVLVLASTSVRRADTAGYAANGAAVGRATAAAAAEDNGSAIRPFRVSLPEAALVDLRRRIAAMRWPDRETVADASQGIKVDKGGHFAAWEQPQLFSNEVRAGFRPLRRIAGQRTY